MSENHTQHEWKILLPKDPDKLGQLKQKLEIYEKRIIPGFPNNMQMDSLLKRDVLKRLIERSEVSVVELSGELKEKYGPDFDSHIYLNAAHVMQAYTTGGGNIRGGSLPDPK